DGLREIVALAASTGMRRGEILSLRYLDVDLSNKMAMLPNTKNGELRIVHLNEMAMMVFESMTGNPGDRIFAEWTVNAVWDGWRRARTAIGRDDFRFHDLRHTAASWMRMTGADIHTVAQLLGHKDLRMAARYQHLSPAFLAEAVGKLDGVFGSLRGETGVDRDHSVTTTLALGEGSGGNGEE